MYEYTWYQWILFFFCYCFFGWIFESTYVSLKTKHFVNRGFLRLPMLPLYGTGAVMMLFVSLPVKDNLILVYCFGVVAATILEYVTGWGMEKLFKMKYWDYSNQRFQIKGYICLSSSIAWGFLTIFLTEVIHKPIETVVLSMNPILDMILVCSLGTVFVADTIVSTKSALDLGRALEAMSGVRADLEEMQVQLALLKSELKGQARERAAQIQKEVSQRRLMLREEAAARMNGWKDSAVIHMAEVTADRAAQLKAEIQAEVSVRMAEVNQRVSELREDTEEYLEERSPELFDKIVSFQEKLEGLKESSREWKGQISGVRRYYFKGILSGNRIVVPERHRESLKELLKELEKRKEKK